MTFSRHPNCEGPACGWCDAYLVGWADGRQRVMDEIEDRLTTEHEPDCYCLPCRVVNAVAESVESQTWSSGAKLREGTTTI